MMFKMFQRILGCKKDVAVEPKAELKEMPKPSKENKSRMFTINSRVLFTVMWRLRRQTKQ
jgi:hypothetical protein